MFAKVSKTSAPDPAYRPTTCGDRQPVRAAMFRQLRTDYLAKD